MKRWCKLYLVGLVVPAVAAGISLMSVSCGNKQSSTGDTDPIANSIKLPVLVNNPKITSNKESAQAWWQSFGGNVSRQVNALNRVLTPETQLDPECVLQIIPTYDGLNSFKLLVELIKNKVFQNNQTSWLTPFDITYSSDDSKITTSYPIPVLLNKQILGSQPTAQQWWNGLKNVAAQVNALNKVIKKETQLVVNVVQKIDFFPISDKTFSITVYLNSGYVFVDNNDLNYWTSGKIGYRNSGTYQVVVPELVSDATVNDSQSDPQTWWNEFKNNVNSQVFAINRVLKDGTKLDASVVQNIDFESVSANSFKVTVHLKPNYIFNDKSSTWTNEEPITIKIIAIEKINVPRFYGPDPVLTGSQPSAQQWWNSFGNNITKQLGGLWKLFNYDVELNARVVEKIIFTPISFKKFKFTIYLKDNVRFRDGSPFWESGEIVYKWSGSASTN